MCRVQPSGARTAEVPGTFGAQGKKKKKKEGRPLVGEVCCGQLHAGGSEKSGEGT